MNSERQQFLNLRTKPGKLTTEEASWYLGFLVHEIPMLTAVHLLKPLGEPPENGSKFFSRCELDKLIQDANWMARACNTIVKYWKDRNLQRPTENAKARWPHKKLVTSRNKASKSLPPPPNHPDRPKKL